MIIGLLSDTHHYLDDKIFKYLEDCDEIWHGGDFGDISISDRLAEIKPLRGVYGNIDDKVVRAVHPLDQVFCCEEVKVYMTHIGGYPGRYSPHAREVIDKEKPALFICGHSHICKVMRDEKNNLLHINPGAAGVVGFHKVRTMVTLSIDKAKITDLKVIELGKRGAIF